MKKRIVLTLTFGILHFTIASTFAAPVELNQFRSTTEYVNQHPTATLDQFLQNARSKLALNVSVIYQSRGFLQIPEMIQDADGLMHSVKESQELLDRTVLVVAPQVKNIDESQEQLFFAFKARANSTKAEIMDIIRWNPSTRHLEFKQLAFATQAGGRAKVVQAPTDCAGCHGSSAKLMWDGAPFFPGMVGSISEPAKQDLPAFSFEKSLVSKIERANQQPDFRFKFFGTDLPGSVAEFARNNARMASVANRMNVANARQFYRDELHSGGGLKSPALTEAQFLGQVRTSRFEHLLQIQNRYRQVVSSYGVANEYKKVDEYRFVDRNLRTEFTPDLVPFYKLQRHDLAVDALGFQMGAYPSYFYDSESGIDPSFVKFGSEF